MRNDAKTPQIRFGGFKDDWEQRKLGDVVGVYDGTHQTPDYKDHGVMFVSVENIQSLTSDKYISEEDYEKNFFVVPEIGDILMTRIGDIGTANIVTSAEPLAYYVSLALLKNSQLNAEYLKANISAPAFQNELWLRTLHTAYPKKINKDEIGKCMIKIAPQKEEQEQIGAFFESLDNLITLHQRKVGKLVLIKQSMLQKMFPKEGEKTPEFRFEGFTDAWEQRKFTDGVSEVGDGLHGTPTYSDDGDVYFVNGNNLVDGNIVINSETKTVDESQRSVADKSLDGNTILMSINGTIGNLAYYSGEKLMLGKSAAYIKVSEFDKKFVYAYLQAPSVQAYFMDSLTGTTIKNLGLKAIREMRIIAPQDIEEQNKIGEYFSKLDNLITLHQHKLEKLKDIKKTMLEKMFV